MQGVTQIQVLIKLKYDDEFVLTLCSPLIAKDIRHGEFFGKEETAQLAAIASHGLLALLEKQSGLELRKQITPYEPPIQPGPDDTFSAN